MSGRNTRLLNATPKVSAKIPSRHRFGAKFGAQGQYPDDMCELKSGRVILRPIRVEDAVLMTNVLADPSLYEYTGGEPPSEVELVRRYAAQVQGASPDGSEVWINHVVEVDRQAVGYAQATIAASGDVAEVAWVIGKPWQGRGYAKQAGKCLVAELQGRGVSRIVAHIHPKHFASQRIAESLGLQKTQQIVDGEDRWVGAINSLSVE